MKKVFSVIICVALLLSCLVTSASAFTDDSSITYKSAVQKLVDLEVMNGFPDGSFQPKSSLTRGQACKMMCCLMNWEPDGYHVNKDFTDCSEHWAKDYIDECNDRGAVNGYGNGKFGPDDSLTGYQYAKMLICAYNIDSYMPQKSSESWSEWVSRIITVSNLTKGINNFNGDKNLTREQAAQLSVNAITILSDFIGNADPQPEGKCSNDTTVIYNAFLKIVLQHRESYGAVFEPDNLYGDYWVGFNGGYLFDIDGDNESEMILVQTQPNSSDAYSGSVAEIYVFDWNGTAAQQLSYGSFVIGSEPINGEYGVFVCKTFDGVRIVQSNYSEWGGGYNSLTEYYDYIFSSAEWYRFASMSEEGIISKGFNFMDVVTVYDYIGGSSSMLLHNADKLIAALKG